MANLKNWEAEAERIRNNALVILNWSEEQMAVFVEKMGKQFLQSYIPNDPDGIDFLIQTADFWRWWRLNWYHRDKSFEAGCIIFSTHELKNFYLNLHSLSNILQDVSTERYVLGIKYAKSIKQMSNLK